MDHKLYYQDAYLREFTTKLVKQAIDEEGTTYAVLEETAFYPTGGGQPNDLGTLNEMVVVGVEEIDGEIRHYLAEPLNEESNEIRGTIDWERRFDHMQQHAGQHILSAAFEHLFQMKTVSFHLGKETLTIDLEVNQLSEEEANQIEELANRIILENRPIESKWVSKKELAAYSLRKPLAVTENIRLVIIPEFDDNGCGGTHPDSTGQVAAIKILDWEKQKNNTRVRFVCGSRVRRQLFQKHRILSQLSPLLNASEDELVPAVRRQLDLAKVAEKQLEEANESLLNYEALESLEQSRDGIIALTFVGRPIQELQKLARMIIAKNEQITVFLAVENEGKLQFVCARGKEATGDMKKCAEETNRKISGKGGGNASFAQGGGDANIRAEELILLLKNSL